MFRGEAVVDGDNNGGEFTSEAATDGVVCEGGRGEVSEAAAVEEDDDGEGSGSGGVRVRGNEEAEPEVARRVDHDV